MHRLGRRVGDADVVGGFGHRAAPPVRGYRVRDRRWVVVRVHDCDLRRGFLRGVGRGHHWFSLPHRVHEREVREHAPRVVFIVIVVALDGDAGSGEESGSAIARAKIEVNASTVPTGFRFCPDVASSSSPSSPSVAFSRSTRCSRPIRCCFSSASRGFLTLAGVLSTWFCCSAHRVPHSGMVRLREGVGAASSSTALAVPLACHRCCADGSGVHDILTPDADIPADGMQPTPGSVWRLGRIEHARLLPRLVPPKTL